ncbi:hypothetical protein T02_11379 [Trichinella nativa]|uniref:Uncharacterized protein n=1 Tax=Trichinella nativa TaxID=6335 RepID=A0A0V1KNJ0_9BILA|nr:hypothetical protein T02_11379 [Trichinella nativa]
MANIMKFVFRSKYLCLNASLTNDYTTAHVQTSVY